MRLDWEAYLAAEAHATENLEAAELVANRAVSDADSHVSSLLDDTGIGVLDALIGAVGVAGDLASGLLESLADTSDYWGAFFQGIANHWNESQQAIFEAGFNFGNAIVGWMNQRWEDLTAIREMLPQAKPDSSIGTGRTVEDYQAAIANQPRVIQATINVMSLIAGAYSLLTARMKGYLSGVEQTSMMESQTTPLSVGQLSELLKRQEIGEDFAKRQATRSGLSGNLFDLVMKLERQRLTPSDYIATWLRTKNEAHIDEIRKLGVAEDDIERLLFLAFAEPTPSDIVRFLVRDAYDEAVVRESGLDTDFEAKYNRDAFDRVGVSEELARLYWRAHWQLPSPTQGYEMVHRGLIDIPQLQSLLKQADYAPGYVQHLIDIAYNVPGRIDLRRMWETGSITDRAELVTRYKHLGYNDADAELLTSFSIAISDKTKRNEAERKRAPMAREIVKSYTQGTLSRELAIQSLISLGFTQEDAEARMVEGEYGRERDRTDRIRDSLGRLYTRGQLDRDSVVSRLHGFGFLDGEISVMLDSWDIDRELRDLTDAERHEKDLSRTDIVRAFEDGILAPSDAYSSLQALGYDAQEADTILELSAAKSARQEAKVEQDNIKAQYVNRRIERAEAASRLDAIGTVAAKRDSLIDRWTVEREERAPDIPLPWFERLLFNGQISQEDARTELERRGFTPQEVEWSLNLWGEDMSVARDKLAQQQAQFQQTAEQRAQQFAQRISVQERALALRDRTATTAQILQQERFQQTMEQRDRLQKEREDAASAGRAQSAALQAQRDAGQLAARREQQDRAINSQMERLTKQIEAQVAAREDNQAAQRDLEAQREAVRLQLNAAQDARQQRQLESQERRLTQQISAANTRAAAANDLRLQLQDRQQAFAEQQRKARDSALAARAVEQEAARIRQESRQEGRTIRTEQRGAERKTIDRAEAAAAADRVKSLSLQRENMIAELTAQLAALEAGAAEDRIAQAEAQATEARRRLESLVGPALVFEPAV